MPIRKVTNSEVNGIQVRLCSDDNEKLAISDYHRIYLAYRNDPAKGTGECLYKLHLDNDLRNDTGQTFYRWIAMWNSVTWTSMRKQVSFKDIKSALEAAIEDGYIVVQANWDNFKDIIYGITHL